MHLTIIRTAHGIQLSLFSNMQTAGITQKILAFVAVKDDINYHTDNDEQ
jgi:hypothetical protein